MFKITTSGSFKNFESFAKRVMRKEMYHSLERYAIQGMDALANATPVSSGQTAASWSYEIKIDGKSATITWLNSHVEGGAPIAVLIQYGHGTRNGGYVQGRDYINPAIRPVFDKMADDVWEEVTR